MDSIACKYPVYIYARKRVGLGVDDEDECRLHARVAGLNRDYSPKISCFTHTVVVVVIVVVFTL